MVKIASFLGLSLVVLAGADAVAPLRTMTMDLASAPPARTIALRGMNVPSDWPPVVPDGNTVPFASGSVELEAPAHAVLDALATRLAAQPGLVVELRGYAAAIDDELQARRLSLARAINVRAYLIADGVPKNRLILRALGDRTAADHAPDRVDLVALAPRG